MDDVLFQDTYGLTDEDKERLVKRLSQDITFDDDALFEIDAYHENTDDYESLEEVG